MAQPRKGDRVAITGPGGRAEYVTCQKFFASDQKASIYAARHRCRWTSWGSGYLAYSPWPPPLPASAAEEPAMREALR